MEAERETDEEEGGKELWWMDGLFSVAAVMANYSRSTLRRAAGGADSVLSGWRISLYDLHWEEESVLGVKLGASPSVFSV